MLDQVAEKLAHRRRIERAEIVGFVRHAGLPCQPRGFGAVEHRDELVGILSRTDHRHRQVVVDQLEQLFEDAQPSGSDDQARTEQRDVHAALAPFMRQLFGLPLRQSVFAERRDRVILGHRIGHGMTVDHVGGEVDEIGRAGLVHRIDDVDRPVIIHRKEEIVPLRPHLDRRQHLGRQVVDHVVGPDADIGDRGRVGHVAADPARRAIVRKLALRDVGDNDFLAIRDEFGGKMTADETVAAEDDVSHFASSLVLMGSVVRWTTSSVVRVPPCAIRIVPTQMKAMPAIR